ncbi:tRNA-specific adenosine deaminase, putative [Entamoeba histolytica HM-1:IMSS-B]|uniref:tRNA-specific adenosine deaminase, putative n=6 Tax=Entamoeba histolytica TaxID=5759 RepID=C4M9G3_ENTH1|nr:tRNA-specific adenosine deaminase, putative [Entamoeba histolytica HM-1:IMSS]EMD48289.1 tRNAspecific adenosine deaminase, putative [Entamoeba histolytica KU27]EMH76314.1 tRNA-specific adenosine deaminase, putative [Entamoeba histolytica HM-1:IMSS-B]EMS14342.1 tRNA-specific adenosine deaminase [Entamoeba histolytica HM-3:IMSS]ENY64189.1 tRNA-specific adenosine deaminase, putative [Entamoeba histolytica HM-1:IMSS-A]GAT98307.1 tRNA-Specific adenosine deaminase putative [Entamoeba histolytica]|eukprot:XP_657152.1 tRNA-specific adenosine deaminase, putative [Entamoeba histolytica HM-1:IMSS]
MEKPIGINNIINEVQCKIKEVYNKLPKKGKEQENEWSVLASLIAFDKQKKEYEILSIGTGSKCVTSKQHNNNIINDSHAEVICKRAFQLFLLEQISKEQYIEKAPSKSETETKWKWRYDKYDLIFYISQVPCGDCCISSNGTINKDIETGAKRIINNSIEQTIALWEEKDIKDGIGKTRIKPGKGEKSLSMSCSDKILKWEVLGIQGGILANHFEMIRLNLIIIEKPADEDAVMRGIHLRTIQMNTLFTEKNYKVNIPPFIYLSQPSHLVKHKTDGLSAAGSSINFINEMDEEVTLGARGVKFGAGKKVVDSQRSRLCQMKIREKYSDVFHIQKDKIYQDDEYYKRKVFFKQCVEGGWTIK